MISKSYRDMLKVSKMVGKQLETRKVISVSGGGQHTLLIAKEDSPKKFNVIFSNIGR